MEIIEHGRFPDGKVLFECDYCGCSFKAEKTEYIVNFFKEMICRCPDCGNRCVTW